MKQILIVALMLLTLAVIAACTVPPHPTVEAPIGMPNPASVHCADEGGKLEIRDEAGGQVGYCIFPDGSECEEWAFYRGECNATGEGDRDYCETVDDCVPEQCCHPTSCVNKDYTMNCTGLGCTDECKEDTMDCGCGTCTCIDNKCSVSWTRNETWC